MLSFSIQLWWNGGSCMSLSEWSYRKLNGSASNHREMAYQLKSRMSFRITLAVYALVSLNSIYYF